MLKRIKSKKLKVLICLIVAAAVIFAVVTMLWLVYYNSKVKPLMECLAQYEFASYYEKETRATYYTLEDDSYFANHEIMTPSFLNFKSNVQSLTPYVSSYDSSTDTMERLTDYTYYFSYTPHLFRASRYSFRIDDYSDVIDSFENGVYMSSGPSEYYSIEVDKDMNFISGDKTMYEEHYDELKKLYDEVMEIFGEEAFQ